MERYVSPKKFIQYQLWQDCNNGCKFCTDRNAVSVDKAWVLDFVLERLDDPEVFDYSETGIIGGEIFDNQLDDPEVFNLFYKVIEKMCSMHFEKICIATALLYDMDKYFIPLLSYLKAKGVQDRILICTSYDTKWRFKTKAREQLWSNNMLKLKEEFPEFRTHVQTIITGDFIDKVLSKEFDIAKFCEKYNTRIDFNEPTSGLYYHDKAECQKECPNFFPTKANFIKFIKQECIDKKNVDIRSLASFQLHSDRAYILNVGQYVKYDDRRKEGFCMRSLDTSKKYEVGFIDSDEAMSDVCTEICEML